MRNWHHKIIKLEEALSLIVTNNRTVIGVNEAQIEFENLTNPLHGLNYKAKNRGLFKILNGSVQKSSIIGQNSGQITPNLNIGHSGSHSTSVAGIILGNKLDSNNVVLPIKGIIEDGELMNFSTLYLNLLFAATDNYKYFMNQGSIIINPSFPFSNTTTFNYGNNDYIPPSKQAVIINGSYILTLNSPSDIAIFEVILQTIKTYGNNGRGVLLVIGAGNSNNDTTISQHYGKHFSYPLIISASTIDNEKTFEKVKEVKSSYSCYGDRIDLCGPSNGEKNGIYSTTSIKCGEIGYDDEVITKTITNQSQNDSLTLNNTDLIFPGNCIEVGIPDTVNHEILVVKEVNRTTNKIKFIENRYYTATPFTINPATIRTPILKSSATIIGASKNKLQISDNRGFGYIGQEICIFNGISNHYASISFKNSSNKFEFNPALPVSYSTTNIEVIPGQIVATAASYTISGENTVFTFSSSDNDILNSFFIGGMVAIVESSSGTILSVGKNIRSINTTGTRSITIEKYNLSSGYTSIKLKSMGYGSYTSSFGGTSAACPVVSGVAGLVFKANSALNALEIKHILKSTADKINLKESSSTGRWKDVNGNNINYSSVSSTLTQPTSIGSKEIFVSNISSFNINDAIEIDGDFRSVIENVLTNRLILQLGVTKVYNAGDNVKKGTPPVHSKYYGTGRVNAQRAVQLAIDWHDPTKSVVKPKLAIADRMNPDGSILLSIDNSDSDQTVSSPDIWVLPDNDTSGSVPTPTQPLNTLETSIDQKIHIRVRNLGNKESFKEYDVKVFVAFNDDVDPAFPFPSKWYHQEDVKLLGVKELPIIPISDPIPENNFTILEVEWKDIAAKWNQTDSWNPINSVTGKRKRAYILVHIAPFDGLASDVQLNNLRNNKQLTCKEIIVTHNGVNDRTAFLPGNKLDITVGQELVQRTFDLSLENIATSDLATTKVKATKVNRADQSEVSVFFSKNTNGDWEIEGEATPDWITFDTPDEIASQYDGYKHIKFPHTITVNNSSEEIKIETLNA